MLYDENQLSEKRFDAAKKRWEMKIVLQEEPDSSGSSSNSSGTESESDESAMRDESYADSENDESALLDESFVSRTSRYYKLKLQQLLSQNHPLQNLDYFVHYCRSKSARINIDTSNYALLGKLAERALRYRGDRINKFIHKLSDVYADELLVYWLENLFEHNLITSVFMDQSWQLPQKYTPLQFKVAQTATALAVKYLKRDQTTNDQRILGTRYVAEVAKLTGMSTESYGTINILATHTHCSRNFAKSVLEAVENNTFESFVSRKVQCDSIHANRLWTDKITTFVLKPENTQPVPGREQVSIKYGVRRPKFLLRKPRAVIASEFLDENPTCPFKSSTIIREFPRKDKKRNSCPYHCNARRLVNALHTNDVAKSIPTSCRGMVLLCMCTDESITAAVPTLWNKHCVHGKCDKCPTPQIEIPAEKAKKIISYSLWGYGFDEIKKKKGERQ